MLIVVRAAVQRQVARMVVNPQLENGYTQIANELIEALARFNLSPYESRLLWYIARKTYGYQKKTDAISLGQFALGTGIPVSNVIRTLKKLENRHFITKSKDFYICEYGINKHYDQWLTTVYTDSTPVDSTPVDSAPVDSARTDNKVLPPQTITTAPADNKLLPPQRDTKERKKLTKDNKETAELASLLKELILTNNPKALLKENILTTWGKTFDLMLTKDKREPEDIAAVIRWTQADDFEKTNVLSADKVRARFDNLYMKMNAKSNNGHSKQQAPASMYQYVTGEALDDDN